MKSTVVRYQAKPDRAEENQRLVEAVFADLEERKPEGFTYKVFRLEDGVSFVHIATTATCCAPGSPPTVNCSRSPPTSGATPGPTRSTPGPRGSSR